MELIAHERLKRMSAMISGAIAFYEMEGDEIIQGLRQQQKDALPLNQMAKEQEEWIAANAFNTIGEALYSLRQHIRTLHEAHIKEVMRQLAEDDES